VEAAATYLLFNPNDAEMLRNKAYYIQKLGYHQAHFVPRQVILYNKNFISHTFLE